MELTLSVLLQVYIILRYNDNLMSITHILKRCSQHSNYNQNLMILKILQLIERFQILPHSSSFR